jgi:hypothetical protein
MTGMYNELFIYGGVNTSELETVSVQYFENRAPIIYPSLSQDMTETLKDMFQSRTRLSL